MAIKVIDNWRRAHKFGSLWWTLAGILFSVLEVLNSTWFSLPYDIQQKLPNASVVSLVLFICVAIARVINWVKPDKE
ncbi:hypothetical protein FROZEN_91 [Erwinia phage vB_EamP_Frozen]|uniref:Uncharacterized protein n=4 Tax=Johnsonvirus TaxID=1982576 RepID=A0A191ZD43_9CAUD|nr:holin [Erwinia phage Ea9-2]YP_009286212.1 holin [Erwinia phage vB_EamP_Frozen]ANJ65311.1 hypothetical protein REXELLA_90 [Erwinia phage vB_EamP_Rexella]ANJ65387.1 hypothetical protein GUTMEISTER_83 [Erwinia phage vB_EamP_Gutmeister]AHI60142.1 putative holin [Erwinia phage Ea9-2]ANJ65212.1 hypothetical protein FROZEN_91 [Erwinia phage vB_EamP_Frozen]